MGLGPNDVAPNGNLFQSAPRSPLLNRLDETPSDAARPSPIGHNQSANLAHAIGHKKVVLRALNPANDFAVQFRNENHLIFAPVQLFEPAFHIFAIDWVAENAAQCGHVHCIPDCGFANNDITHGGTDDS
jgi:hypothetical protein